MDRIGPAGGSPTIALTNGAQGFVDENLASGQEGTLVPAAFMNAVQEELMSVLAAGSIAPNIAVFNQVLSAINAIASSQATEAAGYANGSIQTAINGAGIAFTAGNEGQLLTAITTLIGNLLAAGLGGNISGSGWERLAGSLLLQWGEGLTVTGNQDYVAFPTSFPANLFCVVAQEANAAGWGTGPTPDVYGTTRADPGRVLSGFLVSCSVIQRNGVPEYSGAGAAYNYIALGN